MLGDMPPYIYFLQSTRPSVLISEAVRRWGVRVGGCLRRNGTSFNIYEVGSALGTVITAANTNNFFTLYTLRVVCN